MKLCKICDRKIEGSWCKTCRRFVKTYELSDRIHFNESHNPENDADCTYHVDPKKSSDTVHSTVVYGTGTNATRQTYTQTVTGTKSSAATGNKKKGKLAVVLIILYIVINFMGALIPNITNCVSSISDELKDSFVEEYGASGM